MLKVKCSINILKHNFVHVVRCWGLITTFSQMTLDADLHKLLRVVIRLTYIFLSLLGKFHFIWISITDTCQVCKQNILKFYDLENNNMDQVHKVILPSKLFFSRIPLPNRF